jgi:hypothetical protein
MVGKWVEAEGS